MGKPPPHRIAGQPMRSQADDANRRLVSDQVRAIEHQKLVWPDKIKRYLLAALRALRISLPVSKHIIIAGFACCLRSGAHVWHGIRGHPNFA